MTINLERFITAQKEDYSNALKEIQNGRKQTHWMWYIFPQIHGLGFSSTSKYYEIKSLEEAIEYLKNEYLRNNLVNICESLLNLDTRDPEEVFGEIDAMKLQSSMTLFNYIVDRCILKDAEDLHYREFEDKINFQNLDIFKKVLDKFFNSQTDLGSILIFRSELTLLGLSNDFLVNISEEDKQRALELLIEYSSIKPISLNKESDLYKEDKYKRERFEKTLSESDLRIFNQMRLNNESPVKKIGTRL